MDDPEEPLPHAAPPPPTQRPRDGWPVRLAVVALVLVGLALRLRDPLATPIIGAEDPYLHMERTWDLAQGRPVTDYPPGFMVLLLPFALAGPATFAVVARLAPPLAGIGLVWGMYALCRAHLPASGALAGAGLVAVMPEAIRRTDLLFPTALDLALLPWALLLVLRLPTGGWRTWLPLALFAALLLVMHPWLLGLMAIPLGFYATVRAVRRSPLLGVVAAAGAAAALLALAYLMPSTSLVDGLRLHARDRLAALVAHPSSLTPLPVFVDLPGMLGWPALACGLVGLIVAARRRDRFALLAVALVLTLLPLVLVDWFGVWYLPHRTVAFLALGIAMSAAMVVAALAQATARASPAVRAVVPTLAVVGLLAFTAPATAAMEPWYRLYTPEESEAWADLDELAPPHVVAGSWQARATYRGLTGRSAEYNPDFFTDERTRTAVLAETPGLLVVVDRYAHDADVPTGFLGAWREVGTWGATTAYAPP